MGFSASRIENHRQDTRMAPVKTRDKAIGRKTYAYTCSASVASTEVADYARLQSQD
jgi:hypothetical protein